MDHRRHHAAPIAHPRSPHKGGCLHCREADAADNDKATAAGRTGDATFTGDNPPDGAVITYYQKSRHLFGKFKLEMLDASGRVVDELPASKRPGLNRVVWSMTKSHRGCRPLRS